MRQSRALPPAAGLIPANTANPGGSLTEAQLTDAVMTHDPSARSEGLGPAMRGVADLIAREDPADFFLGDNGGRPRGPEPALFARAAARVEYAVDTGPFKLVGKTTVAVPPS